MVYDQSEVPASLVASTYNSGFELAHDTYNGLSAASDGRIYYVLSSQSVDVGGKMYCFDPSIKTTKFCGDLTEACGEKGMNSIVQGKSHVKFVESGGKLYFGTHIGYYSMVEGMEKMGIPPEDYKAYPGGHLLAYDLASGKYDDLAIAPHREGILAMNMDAKRNILYGLTWPTGYFFRYNITSKEMEELGSVSGAGEDGMGDRFRTVCRAIAIDPEDGAAYITNSSGDIYRYSLNADTPELLQENMRKDYFGSYDPGSPGHMGYNWRQIVYCATENCFYGVHGNSGYLFKFDPKTLHIEVLDRLCSDNSKRSGMFDQFSYGYLGFEISGDDHRLYYLTGAPMYENGKRVTGKANTAMGEAKGLEDLHLVTYDIPTGVIKDHGAIFYESGERPLYVNSIAVSPDGTVYTLARITENGKSRTDLVRIPVNE